MKYSYNLISIFISLLLTINVQSQNKYQNHLVDTYVPNELLIQFHKDFGTSSTVSNWAQAATNIQKFDSLNQAYQLTKFERIGPVENRTFLLCFDNNLNIPELVDRYESIEEIKYAEPNYIYSAGQQSTIPYFPNDTYFNLQWGLLNDTNSTKYSFDADIDMELAWGIERGDSTIVVAIIDAGLRYDNPDFEGRIWRNKQEVVDSIDNDGNGYIDDIIGWDFINDDNDPINDNGHGTAVTGVLAAIGDNNFGIAGVDWNCKIMPIKVCKEKCPNSYIANAIYYATDHGADVINLSLGGVNYSQVMEQATQYAYNKGVTIVTCMMNENTSTPYYPAAYSETIAVGATNSLDVRAVPFANDSESGSNFGEHIDVVAPGNSIASLGYYNLNNTYWIRSGTSLAAPLVSGLCALLLAQDTSRTPEQLRSIIRNTAEDQVGDPIEDQPGFDIYYGYGRVNAYKALTWTTGLRKERNIKSNVKIYPNPARDQIHWSLEEKGHQVKEIIIFDSKGKICLYQTGPDPKKLKTINVFHLKRGMYWLSVKDVNGKMLGTMKFIHY